MRTSHVGRPVNTSARLGSKWAMLCAESPWGSRSDGAGSRARAVPGATFQALDVRFCAVEADKVPNPANRGVGKVRNWQRAVRRMLNPG